jgi:oxygen-independent coproporphyrinogen-3 oxidase
MESWLAAGPAASGTVIDDAEGTGFRYSIAPDLEAYLSRFGRRRSSGSPVDPALSGSSPAFLTGARTENLDRFTLMLESCLMGFRYIEGPDRDLFVRRFDRDIEDCLPRTFARWRERGLMCSDSTALNREGLLFLNPFLADIFQELRE